MSYSIHIKTNSENPQTIFSKKLTEEEFNTIDRYKSAKTFGLFTASLITVRTNTLRNFCNDFFLPTVVNHALKTDQLATKVIKTVLGLILDFSTFPVRLITLVPRVIYNHFHQKENHPLYQYLLAEGVQKTDLQAEQVIVEKKKHIPVGDQEERTRHGSTFNFIGMPKINYSINYSQGSKSSLKPQPKPEDPIVDLENPVNPSALRYTSTEFNIDRDVFNKKSPLERLFA